MTAAELDTFLARYPETTAVDFILTDTSGILRGKRIKTAALARTFQQGIRLPGSMFSMDATAEIIYDTGFVLEEGEADRLCRPIPGTLHPTPWAEPPVGQVLATMVEPDGSGFFAEPRQVLARVLERLTAKGLRPAVAVELEFYLLDRDRNPAGELQPARSPLTGRRQASPQVYSLSELADFAPVLSAMSAACDAQGIETHTTVSESTQGHYEINLGHLPDALAAADRAILFKHLVKGVAAQHGLDATFMAKPLGACSGSGLHVHVSLLDADDRNVFAAADGDRHGSELLQQAIAGLCATMPESMAIFAPNANSFRRYQERAFVPLAPCWGANNRTTALRLPPGDPTATRIEHRVPGADANVYLTVAAILAGIDCGLSQQLSAPPPTEGNAYDQHPASLPRSWREALAAFEQGEILRAYFGDRYHHLYHCCKRAELRKFEACVTPLELDWYLYNL